MNNLLCLGCQFLLSVINGKSLQRIAFPYGKPTEILDGSHDHHEPYREIMVSSLSPLPHLGNTRIPSFIISLSSYIDFTERS
jgi:hypothetical protein